MLSDGFGYPLEGASPLEARTIVSYQRDTLAYRRRTRQHSLLTEAAASPMGLLLRADLFLQRGDASTASGFIATAVIQKLPARERLYLSALASLRIVVCALQVLGSC